MSIGLYYANKEKKPHPFVREWKRLKTRSTNLSRVVKKVIKVIKVLKEKVSKVKVIKVKVS